MLPFNGHPYTVPAPRSPQKAQGTSSISSAASSVPRLVLCLQLLACRLQLATRTMRAVPQPWSTQDEIGDEVILLAPFCGGICEDCTNLTR